MTNIKLLEILFLSENVNDKHFLQKFENTLNQLEFSDKEKDVSLYRLGGTEENAQLFMILFDGTLFLADKALFNQALLWFTDRVNTLEKDKRYFMFSKAYVGLTQKLLPYFPHKDDNEFDEFLTWFQMMVTKRFSITKIIKAVLNALSVGAIKKLIKLPSPDLNLKPSLEDLSNHTFNFTSEDDGRVYTIGVYKRKDPDHIYDSLLGINVGVYADFLVEPTTLKVIRVKTLSAVPYWEKMTKTVMEDAVEEELSEDVILFLKKKLGLKFPT